MTVIFVLLGALGVYGLAVLAAAWVSVRPPRIPVVLSPGLLGLPERPVALQTADGRHVRGWWVEGGGEFVAVCVHGYLMNRSEFVPLVPLLVESGGSCLLVDLRGHGGSGPGPVTFGMAEQAEVRAAVAHAREQAPGAKVVVLGSSMGAAAAALAIEADPGLVDGFLADSMYARLDEAASGWWSFFLRGRLSPLFRPVSLVGAWITGVRPKQVTTVGGVSAMAGRPVLLVFGEADPLVPPSSRALLAERAGPGAKVVVVEGGSHGDARLRDPALYRAALCEFLERFAARAHERAQ
jgi:pimeloyl-ACP methyl ester carboxylesterase